MMMQQMMKWCVIMIQSIVVFILMTNSEYFPSIVHCQDCNTSVPYALNSCASWNRALFMLGFCFLFSLCTVQTPTDDCSHVCQLTHQAEYLL
jgi:hypothetical protein